MNDSTVEQTIRAQLKKKNNRTPKSISNKSPLAVTKKDNKKKRVRKLDASTDPSLHKSIEAKQEALNKLIESLRTLPVASAYRRHR